MAREKLTVASETDGDPWLKLGPSSYKADGETELFIAWREVGESGGLRVVPRERVWQDSAKLDVTGAMPDTFQLSAVFHNDVSEPEVDTQNIQIWPDLLEALIKQFKTGKTATLNLPWKRGLRVKPMTWERRATSETDRGGEQLTVNFKADNEDNLDREAFEAVSVKATVKRAAEEAVFALEQDGMAGDFVGGILELSADLAGLMNQPAEFAQAIVTQASRLRRAALILIGTYSTPFPGQDQMNGPDGANARAKLLALLELAAGAEAEARSSLPATRTLLAERRTTIWDIATELGQRARELMSINSAIEDFSLIEKGTAVQVFAE